MNMRVHQAPVAFVTGGTRGLGRALVKQLFAEGYSVYFTGRNEALLVSLCAELEAIKLEKNLQAVYRSIVLDQSDLDEVAQIDMWVDDLEHIDLLVNNAGLIPKSLSTNKQGFEECFGVNYLSHVLLTKKLWSKLQKSQQARVINVSSLAFGNGTIDWHQPRAWPDDGWQAYGNSKLALIMFTEALASRNKDAHITINSMCPGIVDSDLLKDHPLFPPAMLARLAPIRRSAEESAEYITWMALEPQLSEISGCFFSRNQAGEQPMKFVFEAETVDRLWDLTLQWIAHYPVMSLASGSSSHPWGLKFLH